MAMGLAEVGSPTPPPVVQSYWRHPPGAPGCQLVLAALILALVGRTGIGRGVDGRAINSFAGPYILHADLFYMCEPPNRQLPWRWFFRTSHYNPRTPKELQRLTGNVTSVNITTDDSVWMRIFLDIWSNNQWKENAFVVFFKDKACTNLKVHLPGFYKNVYAKQLGSLRG
ncbi:uncharacterized protein LOC127751625 isoform X2 [Frankliniella occidentalis]|uniref:Uncharacterized protein LOC127751625 isoform X2 n=1 Tax=Frankliniella occidentalis TaxID=133901 RepID=A0A9C6XU33_FRAOC|nr:uncharacterized protein LOC127751625 isoform X2 [Frankliniella occidentalis]